MADFWAQDAGSITIQISIFAVLKQTKKKKETTVEIFIFIYSNIRNGFNVLLLVSTRFAVCQISIE